MSEYAVHYTILQFLFTCRKGVVTYVRRLPVETNHFRVCIEIATFIPTEKTFKIVTRVQ